MAMAAQQRQWRCSNGLGGTAIGMAVQQWLRRHSDGNGNGGAAMGEAVVEAAQQWRCSNDGGGAAWWWTEAIIEYHRILYHNTLFLSYKWISYVAFYVGPIQTGFLMTF